MEDLKNPKVSIYLCLYNLEDFVERALESIPKRDDIEVIVVDDCSTDSSLDKVLSFWEKTDLNMQVIHHRVNKGISVATNTALDRCKGEYIFGFDPDDYLYTEEFEKAMEFLDGTDIVYINARINSGQILLTDDTNHNHCASWFKFIRREYLGDLRRVYNSYGGDYEMNMELVSKRHTSVHTHLTAYHYNYPREGSIIWSLTH